MPEVLLATSADHPDGEPAGGLLLAALEERGIEAAWAVWDDPEVDWAGARLVAVRSTWDYQHRREEFLAWARAVQARTRLVNPAAVLEWNTDKAYLAELAAEGWPVVPTVTASEEDELQLAIAGFECAVVKPRVSASGRGVVVFDGRPGGEPALDEAQLGPGPWVVQPLVESVRTEGEKSVFVLGGRAVSQVDKRPGPGEIRVHETYGGSSRAVALDAAAADLAERTVAMAEQRFGTDLAYARVDLMRLDGRLVLGELEVTEPGLYLDLVPGNAAAYAEALAALVDR